MIDPELLRDFIVESLESIDKLDQEMIQLEAAPKDQTLLNAIFRRVHTIKGTSGFLELGKLQSITHVGENLLDALRSAKLQLTPEISSILLALFDAMRSILSELETSSQEGEQSYAELVEAMSNILGNVAPKARQSTATEAPVPVIELTQVVSDCVNQELLAELAKDPAFAEELKGLPKSAAPSEADEPTCQPAAKAALPAVERGTSAGSASVADSSLRVDVNLLDKLVNLVGELVLTRNQILQFNANSADNAFLKTTQRLNLITSELQEQIMRTRMQPIANVWNKFPRVVRDMARSCGKDVRLEMEGKETELDKTILEAIKDPLTHLVRNSVDHGIESPDLRQAAGKEREGLLLLGAYHESGQVILEITDDGAGLNIDRIKRKAEEKGLYSANQLAAMSNDELHKLIFAPGFSTAEKVTNISGRGVGMDVVRSNIERIGGRVEVSSKQGQGTTIQVKIPLTLAVVPALIVCSARQRFAIPQVALVELVRLTADKLAGAIEDVAGASFYRLREKLLPLVNLNQVLKLASSGPAGEQLEAEKVYNIVVVAVEGRQFGIIVDEVRDTEEIVVKPLSKQLKQVSVFAGATIMGDGQVALILDVLGLSSLAGVFNAAQARQEATHRSSQSSQELDRRRLLLVNLGLQARCAIPLEAVSRLEEFEVLKFERASGHRVIQYRGSILPLLNLREFFGARDESPEECELQRVVVYQGEQQTVGLMVQEILDIVEESIDMQLHSNKRGILGSAVIQQKVTDLLNIEEILNESEKLSETAPL